MPSIHKSVLLPYSSLQMFELVDLVESYPQFLPWCGGTSVRERTRNHMLATLSIDYHGIKQSFTTENEMHSPHRISMKLLEGPFTSLDGHWHFHSLREDACKVEFRLDYAFKSGLLGQALVPVFDHIARSFVDAFVRRAEHVYAQAPAVPGSRAAPQPPAPTSPAPTPPAPPASRPE